VEKVFGTIFMLLNIVVAAWIIGSITLLIVKGDEKTGAYRDNLDSLQQYGRMHEFDDHFMSGLKSQLKLGFQNQEVCDEQVLRPFPSAVRRKILRKLYLKPLLQTQLMKGVRQQFLDAFLVSCKVEIFSPGEQVVERGSILSDLFLLVGGVAEAMFNGDHHTDIEKEDSSASDPFKTKFEAGDCTYMEPCYLLLCSAHSHTKLFVTQLLEKLAFSRSLHKLNLSLVSPCAKP
jgi:hypothetical protein